MRRSIIIMALCLLTSWTWAQEFQKTSSGIKTAISGKQTDIEIQWFGPNTLRVLKTPQGKSVKKESLSVIAHPQNSGIKITTPGNGCIVMTSQTLTVTLNPQTGIIRLLLLLTMPDAPPIAFIKASQQAKKKVFTDSDNCKMGR